jgi:hypothetical protein
MYQFAEGSEVWQSSDSLICLTFETNVPEIWIAQKGGIPFASSTEISKFCSEFATEFPQLSGTFTSKDLESSLSMGLVSCPTEDEELLSSYSTSGHENSMQPSLRIFMRIPTSALQKILIEMACGETQ